MLDEGQLDAENHPTISFRSTGCSHISGDRYNVTGNFTLLGNSRSITVPMEIGADSSRIGASGTFSIQGSDYGLEPYTAMMGQLKNSDQLDFTVRLSATN